MRPEWSGSVRLRSPNPDDLPLVSELSLDSDRDMGAVFEGFAFGRQLARAKCRPTWSVRNSLRVRPPRRASSGGAGARAEVTSVA